jgi:hypothetical protein
MTPPQHNSTPTERMLTDVLGINALGSYLWLLGSSNGYYRWRQGRASGWQCLGQFLCGIWGLYIVGGMLVALRYLCWGLSVMYAHH